MRQWVTETRNGSDNKRNETTESDDNRNETTDSESDDKRNETTVKATTKVGTHTIAVEPEAKNNSAAEGRRLAKKEHAVIAEERTVVEGIHTTAPPSVSIQTIVYELVNCIVDDTLLLATYS